MARRICFILALLALLIGMASQLELKDLRPRLPVDLAWGEQALVESSRDSSSDAARGLLPGDVLRSIDGQPVRDRFQLDFILDGMRVGDSISLTLQRDGRRVTTTARLVRSVDANLLMINFVVGLLVWSFGLLVLIKAEPTRDSMLFFFMSVSLSVVMWVYFPENTLGLGFGRWLSAALSGLLHPLSIAAFVHFAWSYPDGYRWPWLRSLLPVIYMPALALGGALAYSLLQARASLAPVDVDHYRFMLNRLLPAFLGACFGLGLIGLLFSYRKAERDESRARLRWLFWGFALGLTPVIFLNKFPKALGASPILGEHVSFALVVLAPLACFIGVIRHKMLDINLILRKSLAYVLLSIFVVVAYLGLVGLGDAVAAHIWGQGEILIRVLVVLLLATAFGPTRELLQGTIDRLFAATEKHQRAILLDYSRELAHTIDIYRLARSLSDLLEEILPVEKMIIFVAEDGLLTELNSTKMEMEKREPIVLPAASFPGLVQSTDSGAFAPADMPAQLEGTEVIVPLRVEDRLAGLLALGKKRSGDTFGSDDHHMLKALAAQTAVAFDRARAFKMIKDMNVSLEQKVWTRTEQLADANDRLGQQYEQLRKLNEMKEALTRMVVHDLKNPVSTILLGLEFLDRSQVASLPENVTNTLNIISSTALEIQDLISNLLDVYRMETGELRLNRKPIALTSLFKDATDRVGVLAQYRRVELLTRADGDLEPALDRDMFIRVLINLLTNAIKHSRREQQIELAAVPAAAEGEPSRVEMSVTNRGAVIPTQLHQRVFEKFFQVEGKKTGIIAGTGLGLAFCRLVVEAHGGRIWVESPPPGREDGARFSISIPLRPAPASSAPASSAEVGAVDVD